MVALRDISAGDQLLIDYGAEYWQLSHIKPIDG